MPKCTKSVKKQLNNFLHDYEGQLFKIGMMVVWKVIINIIKCTMDTEHEFNYIHTISM